LFVVPAAGAALAFGLNPALFARAAGYYSLGLVVLVVLGAWAGGWHRRRRHGRPHFGGRGRDTVARPPRPGQPGYLARTRNATP
jgi:hypothetical protein